MNKFLKGLELCEQDGGWVEPFAFTAAARAELRQWLDDAAIDRLQGLIKAARQIETANLDEPTLRENRAVLERIHALADALATAINQAPSIAEAELDLIGHQEFGDPFRLRKMAIDLQTVADAAQCRAEQMPQQSRRQSHVFMVSCIAEVATSQGIKVSEATNAKFPKLCQCVFESVKIFADVRGSIRAYLAKGHNR